jgi:hypothetical protein
MAEPMEPIAGSVLMEETGATSPAQREPRLSLILTRGASSLSISTTAPTIFRLGGGFCLSVG